MNNLLLFGHISLGYLFGRIASRISRTKCNVWLICFFSLLPDFDLLIPGLTHRGPTHSIVFMVLVFIPTVLYLGVRKAFPYCVALATHSLIGDYFTGGSALLWPLTDRIFGFPNSLSVFSMFGLLLELTLLLLFLILLLFPRYQHIFLYK